MSVGSRRSAPSSPSRLHTQEFVAAGGHLKDAKNYLNVIDECFFDIPVNHVCPEYTVCQTYNKQVCLPGLHITLGIFMRLFTLMEDECHKLDLEMAESESMVPSAGDKQTYTNFTTLIAKERGASRPEREP